MVLLLKRILCFFSVFVLVMMNAVSSDHDWNKDNVKIMASVVSEIVLFSLLCYITISLTHEKLFSKSSIDWH